MACIVSSGSFKQLSNQLLTGSPLPYISSLCRNISCEMVSEDLDRPPNIVFQKCCLSSGNHILVPLQMNILTATDMELTATDSRGNLLNIVILIIWLNLGNICNWWGKHPLSKDLLIRKTKIPAFFSIILSESRQVHLFVLRQTVLTLSLIFLYQTFFIPLLQEYLRQESNQVIWFSEI